MATIFGYFRLADRNNPHKDEYRAMLRAAGASEIVDDSVDLPGRPEFERLIAAIARRGDAIAVVRLGHFSADVRKVLEIIMELHRSAIDLLVLDPHIDTRGANGQQIFALTQAIIHLEGPVVVKGGDGGGNGH